MIEPKRPTGRTEVEPSLAPATSGAVALLASTSAAGIVLFAIGAATGPAWPLALFAGIAAAALLLLAGRKGVFPGVSGLSGVAARGADGVLRSVRAEHSAARAALAELRAGDLVAATEARPHLVPRVRAAIATATEGLASLADQLREVNGEMASSADGVVRMTAELASSSSELSASVAEITAAMEELARTASGISERATAQAELAARVELRGATGEDALVEAVGGVGEVEARIAAIAERTDALGARSKEIYRVLDLIAEIAQETHVLSLNAAIEAAAAGTEGRRIAVVAEEVRRLASRSRDSVASVRGLLDEFSASIRGTVVATEEGAKETRRVLGSAEQAAVAVAELRAVGAETASRARKISAATREQDGASDEVVATLRDVGYVVERTAKALHGLDVTQTRLERLVLGVELLAQGLRRDSPTSLVHLASGWAERVAGLDTGVVPFVPQRLAAAEGARRSEEANGTTPGSSTDAAHQRVLDDLLVEAPYLDDAYLVDAKGYALFLGSRRKPVHSQASAAEGGGATASPEAGEDRDLAARPWFRAVVARGRTVLTAPYVSVNGRTCFTVAVPAFGPNGELRSVLGVDVDVHNWTRIGVGG